MLSDILSNGESNIANSNKALPGDVRQARTGHDTSYGGFGIFIILRWSTRGTYESLHIPLPLIFQDNILIMKLNMKQESVWLQNT